MRSVTSIRERTEPGLFRPIDGRRAFEDVTKQVVELIRSGRLSEGDALPPERTLAERMEVSRATLRFAVASLVEDGVLEVMPGRAGGIVVKSSWVPREDPRETRARLRPETIAALLEARREIEPRLAVLAGQRATRADINAMAKAVELHERYLNDRQRNSEAQTRFHRAMWRAASNPVLEEVMRSILDRLELAIDMLDRAGGEREHALELHQITLAAVESGDERAILKAMDRHLGYLEVTFRQAMDEWLTLRGT
jgi:GntR family transcriptional regulator, transcriptional repressor for pyruvate dehydrogenase complex